MTRLTLILCLGEKQEELSCGKKENSFFYVCQLKLFSLFPDCQENKLENNKKKNTFTTKAWDQDNYQWRVRPHSFEIPSPKAESLDFSHTFFCSHTEADLWVSIEVLMDLVIFTGYPNHNQSINQSKCITTNFAYSILWIAKHINGSEQLSTFVYTKHCTRITLDLHLVYPCRVFLFRPDRTPQHTSDICLQKHWMLLLWLVYDMSTLPTTWPNWWR